jgi:hypothetical protein
LVEASSGNSMATNMLAPRKAVAIVIGVVTAAVAWEAQGQPASTLTLPDLTLSMKAVPNPVPYGRGYEIQLIIANTLRSREVPRADPSIPAPPVVGSVFPSIGGHRITRGADVQQVDLFFLTPDSSIVCLRTPLQVQPSISVRCQPPFPCSLPLVGRSPSVFFPWEGCTAGPLKRGGRWVITMTYPNPFSSGMTVPAGGYVFRAMIDSVGKIAERDEQNNTASVTVQFASSP